MTKSELKEREGMYYIGDIVDIDGDGWVDEETAELILVEYNAGVEYWIIYSMDLCGHSFGNG